MPKKTRTTTPEAKTNTDEADVKKCAAHFEACGWDPLDFDARYLPQSDLPNLFVTPNRAQIPMS